MLYPPRRGVMSKNQFSLSIYTPTAPSNRITKMAPEPYYISFGIGDIGADDLATAAYGYTFGTVRR
jgi:hypothetical protein